jgi:hypothetical protein
MERVGMKEEVRHAARADLDSFHPRRKKREDEK